MPTRLSRLNLTRARSAKANLQPRAGSAKANLQRRISLALAFLVCGCTGHGSESHRAELLSFVGLSEAELVRRLGQPDAISGDISQQFVVFNNIDARYVNPSAGYRYDHDYNLGSGRAPAIAEFNCKTTFVIENGWTARMI